MCTEYLVSRSGEERENSERIASLYRQQVRNRGYAVAVLHHIIHHMPDHMLDHMRDHMHGQLMGHLTVNT